MNVMQKLIKQMSMEQINSLLKFGKGSARDNTVLIDALIKEKEVRGEECVEKNN